MQSLLIATHNAGKLREYRLLLGELGFELQSPTERGVAVGVPEDGPSLEENALRKATLYAKAVGLLTLADDSGLEVDALGGAPGVHSARYAPGSDTDRVLVLLNALRDVVWEARTARFRCVIAIAAPDRPIGTAEGTCEGIIALESAGQGGFGYDPVFYLPQLGRTMAELELEEKNRISHRARAAEAALPLLRQLAARAGAPFGG